MSEFTVTRTLKAPRKRVWQVLTSGATGAPGRRGSRIGCRALWRDRSESIIMCGQRSRLQH
jgi:hypothetical protein